MKIPGCYVLQVFVGIKTNNNCESCGSVANVIVITFFDYKNTHSAKRRHSGC
jgi:hypothetical protein